MDPVSFSNGVRIYAAFLQKKAAHFYFYARGLDNNVKTVLWS